MTRIIRDLADSFALMATPERIGLKSNIRLSGDFLIVGVVLKFQRVNQHNTSQGTGVGPVFLYPTGTHPFLGTGTFSIGPTVVVLKQMGGLTAGALMNQLWSVAIEEDRKSFSQMFLQPFLAYTTKTHTTFTLNSEATANWNNTPGDAKWTVPLIFSISQVLKLGKQPVSIQVGGKYYADSPRYGPDWGVRFNFTLLYPTARPKPGPIPGTYSK